MQKKILVIDNKPEYLAYMRTAFGRYGPDCQLELVHSLKETLTYLQNLKGASRDTWPRLILLDLDLPGFDGFDLMEAIKGDEQIRMIPLVVYSKSDYAVDINYCYLINTNAYVRISAPEPDIERLVEFSCRYWLDVVQVAY